MEDRNSWDWVDRYENKVAEILIIKDENQALLSLVRRYQKALREIAEYGGTDMLGKTCSKVAKEALQE